MENKKSSFKLMLLPTHLTHQPTQFGHILELLTVSSGPQLTPKEYSYHQSLMEEQAIQSPIQVLTHLFSFWDKIKVKVGVQTSDVVVFIPNRCTVASFYVNHPLFSLFQNSCLRNICFPGTFSQNSWQFGCCTGLSWLGHLSTEISCVGIILFVVVQYLFLIFYTYTDFW